MTDNKFVTQQKIKDHDYAMRGDSNTIGRIETTSNQKHNSEVAIKEKSKKHSLALQLLLEQQNAVSRFNEVLEALEYKLDTLEELQFQSSLAEKLITENNTEANIEFLIQYHNLEHNDLKAMSSNEVLGIMVNIEQQNKDSIEQIKSDINTLAEEAYIIIGKRFDPDNLEHQALMNRLETIENRAKTIDTNFDKVIESTQFEANWKYSILELKLEENDIARDRKIINSENITDNFNAQSSGIKDLEHEKQIELKTNDESINQLKQMTF